MKIFQSKINKLAGTDYREVYSRARTIFLGIKKRSKRKPYVRSAYFGNNKIFLDYFWEHLHQKNQADRLRRLKFYACALELIQKSKLSPTIKEHTNKPKHSMHRFYGKAPNNEMFVVQIIENLKTDSKYFLSVFPYESSGDK
ncbi:MAG: hypothetical protein P4L74_00500 [Candidatus Doudnabacteria bacterium]|nr:hypothetical protein [Candidatus Doudnabacteria bacterium]